MGGVEPGRRQEPKEFMISFRDKADNCFYFAVLRGTQSLREGGTLLLSRTSASQSINLRAIFDQLKGNHLTAGINPAVDFKVPHNAFPKNSIKAWVCPFCPTCVEHLDV